MPISVMNPQKISNFIDITSFRNKKPFAGGREWLAFRFCKFFDSVHFIIDLRYDPMVGKTEIPVIIHRNDDVFVNSDAHKL